MWVLLCAGVPSLKAAYSELTLPFSEVLRSKQLTEVACGTLGIFFAI